MKCRAFLATALAAAAGVVARRPKPERFVGRMVDWGEPYTTVEVIDVPNRTRTRYFVSISDHNEAAVDACKIRVPGLPA